jgi:hypothetical protein
MDFEFPRVRNQRPSVVSGGGAQEVVESHPQQTTRPPEPQTPQITEADRGRRIAEARIEEQASRSAVESRLEGRVPEETYNQIQQSLSRNVTDWAVTDTDVRNVHSQLDRLSPADYRATMQRMERDGILSRYIDNMDESSRTSFLRQAANNGYIQRSPAGDAPNGQFNPPAPPPLLANDGALPSSVREAIHDHNVGMASRYNDRYEQYIQRYSDAVMQAPNAAAIRLIGPPVARNRIAEPGLESNHPDQQRLQLDWFDRVHANAPHEATGYHAISDRIHDLTGMRRPGDVWLHYQVSGTYNHADDHGNFGVELDGRVSTEQGFETPEIQGTSEVSAGPVNLGVGVGESGSGNAGFEVERGLTEGETMGTGISADSDGTVEATLGVDRNLGSYSSYNPRTAEMEGGVRYQREIGNYEVEARAGIGVRGITEAEALAAVNGPGVFGTPPELQAGQRWDSLPERQREMYVVLGWTRNEWDNNINR